MEQRVVAGVEMRVYIYIYIEDTKSIVYSEDTKSSLYLLKKSEFLSKYSEDFVSEDLCKSHTNLCVETVKSEVNSKQEIGFEDQVGMERSETLKSHNDDEIMLLQNGDEEQQIVLRR
jgi:hypothetical protein